MRFLKSILPKSFKQFLWFVFKSPQRKWHELGYRTIWSDLKAWFGTRGNPKQLKDVTICIGIKNRSSNLLNYVIPSMITADNSNRIILSVFDCGSDDVSDLKTEIEKLWKGKLIYSRAEMKFARSIAFNKAVSQSEDGLVLISDADMSLPKDIVFKVNKYVGKNSAWFPHVWYLNQDGSGRYYTESTGMMATSRSKYFEVGGMDETIKEWGKEDWLLFFSFYKKGIGCIRSNEPEFIHHYHESLKPDGFKPLF